MDSYTQLVHSFVPMLKGSPELAAKIYNILSPMTMCPLELKGWRPVDPFEEDEMDEIVRTMTKSQLRAMMEDNGLDEEAINDSMAQNVMALDDSYTISALLDVSDPSNPRVVMPCDFPAFAERCDDESYMWSRVMTWKALQEYAPAFAAAKHIAVTMDCEVLTFPLPAITGGKRNKGRTARRRLRASRGIKSGTKGTRKSKSRTRKAKRT